MEAPTERHHHHLSYLSGFLFPVFFHMFSLEWGHSLFLRDIGTSLELHGVGLIRQASALTRSYVSRSLIPVAGSIVLSTPFIMVLYMLHQHRRQTQLRQTFRLLPGGSILNSDTEMRHSRLDLRHIGVC